MEDAAGGLLSKRKSDRQRLAALENLLNSRGGAGGNAALPRRRARKGSRWIVRRSPCRGDPPRDVVPPATDAVASCMIASNRIAES